MVPAHIQPAGRKAEICPTSWFVLQNEYSLSVYGRGRFVTLLKDFGHLSCCMVSGRGLRGSLKITQESIRSLGTHLKAGFKEVKHGLKRVWELIPVRALCPSTGIAKLFLTASKLLLAACSHDDMQTLLFLC